MLVISSWQLREAAPSILEKIGIACIPTRTGISLQVSVVRLSWMSLACDRMRFTSSEDGPMLARQGRHDIVKAMTA